LRKCYLEKGKEDKFSPALAVTASLCYEGEGIGGGGSRLCLWAEISTGPWLVHSNVIEKIKILVAKMAFRKGEG